MKKDYNTSWMKFHANSSTQFLPQPFTLPCQRKILSKCQRKRESLEVFLSLSLFTHKRKETFWTSSSSILFFSGLGLGRRSCLGKEFTFQELGWRIEGTSQTSDGKFPRTSLLELWPPLWGGHVGSMWFRRLCTVLKPYSEERCVVEWGIRSCRHSCP